MSKIFVKPGGKNSVQAGEGISIPLYENKYWYFLESLTGNQLPKKTSENRKNSISKKAIKQPADAIPENESSDDVPNKSSVKNMLNSFFFKRGAPSAELLKKDKLPPEGSSLLPTLPKHNF